MPRAAGLATPGTLHSAIRAADLVVASAGLVLAGRRKLGPNTTPCVIRAEYRGGYRIQVTFDDGSEKTIDFQRWLKGPVFEPLKKLKYFRRFFLDGWTIAWPNGTDIAPEALYEYAEAKNERGAA